MIIVLAQSILPFSLIAAKASVSPPPCIRNASELVYVNGALNVEDTFFTCRDNIPDPRNIPTLYNNSLL